MDKLELVWAALAAKGRVARTERIHSLAARAGLDPAHTVRALRRENRIEPLFRGHYLVKRPDEILLERNPGPLELFALGAAAKGIGTWYFALHTALRLNGMSHEHSRIEHVVSDAVHRPSGVPVGGRRFIIHKWKPELARFGLRKHGRFFFSDPEKTVLDLAYVDAVRMRRGKAPALGWKEHMDKTDPSRLSAHGAHYPKFVHELMAVHP